MRILADKWNAKDERAIIIKFSLTLPKIKMIVPVPATLDAEEYIDNLLEIILDDKFKFGAEWDFTEC